ncbi:19477_t:CDS:2 [Gigaspora margarita]|uniref:19477_t:CDS:1 n=1 Tax=Gigaspora margarita TaxID=4874 RepID=A0ABN7WD85_GIGMA|nr:19477_t:CDS:2 [Gigaspora margarita]
MQASSKQASNPPCPEPDLSTTLPTMASQQTELITNLGQIQLPIPQIEQLPAPNDKFPRPYTKVPILVLESITICSEKTLEEIEIDPNLDTALAILTIKLDSLPKTYSQVISSSQTP